MALLSKPFAVILFLFSGLLQEIKAVSKKLDAINKALIFFITNFFRGAN
jgi:hypothetical protein